MGKTSNISFVIMSCGGEKDLTRVSFQINAASGDVLSPFND